jgi:thiol-disulfide isomerase/thioredoxin
VIKINKNKQMKRILMAFVAISLISCAEEKSEKGVTGTAKGLVDGTKLFVSTLGENNQPMPVDTAVVTNGKFTLNMPESETQTINMLQIENRPGNLIFIGEQAPLEFEIYKDSLRSSNISGGKHNELLTKYTNHLEELGKEFNNMRNQLRASGNAQNPQSIAEFRKKQTAIQERSTEFRKELVKNNPGSLVSVMALSDMMNMRSLTSKETRELFQGLSEEMRNSAIGEQISARLEKASATQIGAKAPAFSGPTPDGEELALKDAMGKITLIDFWASWCKPCRRENPNIVRVYEKYHDKGLNIIGVSLDRSKAKWLEAIEADGLTWQHISHLRYWQDPIAQKYSVRSIPKAFLLDENGTIIAKDLRGQALEDKVAELLGE